MSLADLLPMTLAGDMPTLKAQRLPNGVELEWLAEGVVRVDPATPSSGRVLLSAGVHGNETAPVEWLDRWLRAIVAGDVVPRQSLLLVLGNPAALRAGTRYVEQDMNRLFNGAHRLTSGFEATRAALLEGLAESFFSEATWGLHYDLHTAIRGSRFEKFALYPWQAGRSLPDAEYRRLAAASMQAVLTHDRPGHTFSAFTYQTLGVESFTLELGKARPFGDNAALDLRALDDAITALAEDRQLAPSVGMPLRLRVAESLIKHSEGFRLHLDDTVENFTPLIHGATLAEDGERRWCVDRAESYIVFPNPRVAIGQRAGLIVVHEP